MPINRIKKRLDTHYIRWVIFSLVAFGIISLAIRIVLSAGEGVPASDRVYTLSYNVTFRAEDARSVIQLSPPWDTQHAVVIAQTIENPGLQIVRSRAKNESARNIIAVATSAGRKTLTADFTIHTSPSAHKQPIKKTIALNDEQRQSYLSSSDNAETDSREVIQTLKKLAAHDKDKDSLIKHIFKYTNKNIIPVKATTDDASSALRLHKANTLGRARAMLALCRASKIPARLVTGFILSEEFDVNTHYWVEAYNETEWLSYDPENGYYEKLPVNYIPARRGGSSIIAEASSITDISINYDISEQFVPVGKLGREAKGLTDILDLSRLSLDARNSLVILLLLPLGALFTVFCSKVIGIRNYGTFTPTLLALAARYADWLTAMVIFSIVAITGLLGRSFMPDKLSRIPRLSIVFTVAAMSMTLSVSIMDYYSINPAGHVVLLPIIILTTLIDRLYKSLDEDGAKIAMVRFGWTTVIAIGCYFILIQEQLGKLLLDYPEIHMFTLTLVLLLSTYKYKKLSDIRFFKWINEPEKIKSTKPEQSSDTNSTRATENA